MADGTAPRLHASVVNDYDVAAIRADFPILSRTIYGKPLVYLDSAASAQKPRQVLDRLRDFYETDYANVHRGLHYLSGVATDAFEAARERVRRFINAPSTKEIIFTRGATEAINLVAHSFGKAFLKPGDEIVVSALEHHSNIVPWQIAAEERGAILRVAPIDEEGNLLLDAFVGLLGPRTRLVAIAHVSNALGSVFPVAEIVRIAHERGIKVLLDGCQAVVHMPVDVQALGCDFYAFSGHKLYGPSGIGVLYGRRELLEAMPPWQGGGDMIRSVAWEGTEYAALPAKFEAGTPPIAQAVGLAAAIDYVTGVGLDRIAAHEADVLAYATQRLEEIPGVAIVGRAREKASVLSFTIDGVHPHDIGTLVDRAGVAIRAGHHCAQPLMDRLGLPATARASFGLYNTRTEADILAEAVRGVKDMFG